MSDYDNLSDKDKLYHLNNSYETLQAHYRVAGILLKEKDAEIERLTSILEKVVHYIDYFKILDVGQISWGSDDSTMGKARKAFKEAREATKDEL